MSLDARASRSACLTEFASCRYFSARCFQRSASSTARKAAAKPGSRITGAATLMSRVFTPPSSSANGSDKSLPSGHGTPAKAPDGTQTNSSRGSRPWVPASCDTSGTRSLRRLPPVNPVARFPLRGGAIMQPLCLRVNRCFRRQLAVTTRTGHAVSSGVVSAVDRVGEETTAGTLGETHRRRTRTIRNHAVSTAPTANPRSQNSAA
jgi:hypothetical protein